MTTGTGNGLDRGRHLHDEGPLGWGRCDYVESDGRTDFVPSCLQAVLILTLPLQLKKGPAHTNFLRSKLPFSPDKKHSDLYSRDTDPLPWSPDPLAT